MYFKKFPSSFYSATIATFVALLILSTPSYSIPVSNAPRADPPETPSSKELEYDLEILNPSPNDKWISGSSEYFSWIDNNLPPRTTLDFTFVPVDSETNPEAINITRRPLLKYISALRRTLDVVVPYDLISKEQLLQEQTVDGRLIDQINENDIYDKEHLGVPSGLAGSDVTVKTTPHKHIQSLARLYITAYQGKTNKVLLRKSIFPIVIIKDHDRDMRIIQPPLPDLPDVENQDTGVHFDHSHDYVPENSEETLENNGSEEDDHSKEILEDDNSDETLEKKDSEITHHEDHKPQEHTHEHEDHEPQEHTHELEGHDDMDKELSDIGLILSDEHDHGDSGSGEGGEGSEDGENHGHSHSIDPDHFQNEDDIEVWNEHIDDPGYNPPIKITDAGTISITRWIDNKVRFFVGSPYVFAWDFPESGQGLTGTVNVYVEDAYTGQRYDIAAANLPSSIQFMYLYPTAVMISADPTKRIYLRARVEMDLFKEGNIERYTAFSKIFYVERGAL